MTAARDAGRANRGSRISGRVGGSGFAVNGAGGINRSYAERMAALIAWLPVVRIGDLVKDGAKRRRLRRSSILDKITNTNRNAVQAIKAAIPIGKAYLPRGCQGKGFGGKSGRSRILRRIRRWTSSRWVQALPPSC